MKILIVKLSSIGDVVHTLPALAAIRRTLPDAEISWAVERSAAEILRGNEMIDNLIEIDTRSLRRRGGTISEGILRSASRQLRELRRYEFDVALDFQGLLKSASIIKLAKTKKRFGFSKKNLREPASRFLLTDTIEVEPQTHIIRKNLTLAKEALNIEVLETNFEFPIYTDEIHKLEAAQIIEQAGENFAILNPAGGWTTKIWSAEKFGELADKLWEENNLVSIVTTAPNEIELANKVLRNSRSGKVLVAQPSLKGFYELAKHAKIYIGGDTAPTHLAVAANAPIVGIFGPTEWWRNGSPNESDICVERTDINCRVNCHRRACDNWICMDIKIGNGFACGAKKIRIIGEMSRKKATPIQRFRVPLGFLFAAIFLIFARPEIITLIIGGAIAVVGLLIRAWASGHIRKNQTLAVSGPYSYTRNPLYLGSFILGCRFYHRVRRLVARVSVYRLVFGHLFAGDARRSRRIDEYFRRRIQRICDARSFVFSASDGGRKIGNALRFRVVYALPRISGGTRFNFRVVNFARQSDFSEITLALI